MGRATPTPRPSKVPSLRYSSRTRFSTGECSAAQSIFLCPPGAREGSRTSDSLCISLLLPCVAVRRDLFVGGLDLFASAEREAGDEDGDEEGDQAEPHPETTRGGAGSEKQTDDQRADTGDPHQDVTHGLESRGGDLVGVHYLRPEEAPALDAGVEDEQQDRAEHDAHDGVVDRYDGSEDREGHEAQKVVEPGDPDSADDGGEDRYGDKDDELLARVDVLLYVLAPAEVGVPHLVRQEAEEEVAYKAADAAEPQGAEEVVDQVPYRRAPGASRAEQEPEDEREDVRRPQVGEAGYDHEALGRDQDRRVDGCAKCHQHHHLRVPPHRDDLFHLTSLWSRVSGLRLQASGICLMPETWCLHLLNPSTPPKPANRS